MKYYIEVQTPEQGNIISETYESTKQQFEEISNSLSDPKVITGKIDFFTKDGDFVVINELVMQRSVVYIRKAD